MDGESDGDEFYDAAEYQTTSTPENVQTRPDISGDSHIIGVESTGVTGKDPCEDQPDGMSSSTAERHFDNKITIAQAAVPNKPEVECKSDNKKSDLQGEKKAYQDNTEGCSEDNSDITNNSSPAPVAPPRRKKKNKLKQPDMIQSATGNENFKSYICSEKTDEEETRTPTTTQEEVKNNIAVTLTDDNKNLEGHLLINEENVDSDLDISTQEMSEILDRNSCTEVISALHLQRNKSQSISSIGSFCSVSSNISFQEKSKDSKHYGSQNSLESATEPKTPTPVAGDQLTDQEILEAVVVRNLDTGETMPLSEAEKNLPSGVNPLALHIMRLTTEFSSKKDLAGSDREDAGDSNVTTRKILRKKKNLRGLFVRKVKNKDQKMKGTKEGGKRGEESSSSDEENPQQPENYIKVKSANGKGIPIINKLNLIQDFSGKHSGAVWTMKFSSCGKLLGTAGQDKVVHVWVLKTEKEFFEQMRNKYAKADSERPTTPDSEKPPSEEHEKMTKDKESGPDTDYPEGICKDPFCTYEGHTGDVLDLSWSKNYFLLSSSMDKTVRLWHISRNECLCCFQHIDFVTAITFHPRDDRYFLSGSLDGKIRLWNIPDKKVALWNELEGAGSHLITAANFCMNGKFAVIGTYDGRCIFYETEHLKYYTQWQIRSTRKKQGRKISGIEPMPGEDKILITSNDSRIRLYSLKDHSLHCKYKGFTNSSSQIKGSFSHDGELVISGSEDHYVYMWRAQHRITSARKDRNDFYEGFSAHNAVVTVAIFAPCPWNVVPTEHKENTSGRNGPEVVVAADWTGAIKIFLNRCPNEKT